MKCRRNDTYRIITEESLDPATGELEITFGERERLRVVSVIANAATPTLLRWGGRAAVTIPAGAAFTDDRLDESDVGSMQITGAEPQALYVRTSLECGCCACNGGDE